LTAGLAAGPVAVRATPAPSSLRRLQLANPHTGETFEGTYRNDAGPIPAVIDELCVFLRDHHSGEKTQIDVGVLDFLAAVMDAVGAVRATVLSAYRTQETNAMLARTMFGVAENSQHLYGRALDIYLDARLVDAMTAARAMKRGGVGWYPHSGFIHIDTGPVRNWELDGSGFGTLLFDGGRVTIGQGGDLLVGPARGHAPPVMHGRPLSIGERLSLHHQIARAEALVRAR
jgi:uncharacterized protein YcbK (DUF882 family)